MIRRLELAQALVNRPTLLILDEPTVGLDPVARDGVWQRVGELRRATGVTVLLTTHYMVVMLGSGFFSCLPMTVAGVVLKRERLLGIGQMITMPLFSHSTRSARWPSCQRGSCAQRSRSAELRGGRFAGTPDRQPCPPGSGLRCAPLLPSR